MLNSCEFKSLTGPLHCFPQVVTADVLHDAHILILHTVSASVLFTPPHVHFCLLQPVHIVSLPAGPGLPLELLQQSLLLAAGGETRPEGPGSGLLPGPAAGLPHRPGLLTKRREAKQTSTHRAVRQGTQAKAT